VKSLIAALTLTAQLAMAQDSVPSDGPLSDDDFYNLVACAAPPGQDCAVPLVRWVQGDDLTVSLFQVEPGYPNDRKVALTKALYAAIDQINASHAALRLRFAPPGTMANVTVHLLNIPMGGRIERTGLDPLDGSMIEAALVQLWWNGNQDLTRAAIVFPQDIEWAGLRSIALEELTQALGLRTDIYNPWYERRSVFSETSNTVTQLTGQDIMALQRHYPLTK
jgi:hypothetical protein